MIHDFSYTQRNICKAMPRKCQPRLLHEYFLNKNLFISHFNNNAFVMVTACCWQFWVLCTPWSNITKRYHYTVDFILYISFVNEETEAQKCLISNQGHEIKWQKSSKLGRLLQGLHFYPQNNTDSNKPLKKFNSESEIKHSNV